MKTGTEAFPNNPNDDARPQVETFPNACPADLAPPFLEAKEIFENISKDDARQQLRDPNTKDLTESQKDKILKQLKKGRADSVSVKIDKNGNARLSVERAGRVSGFQRFSYKIAPDGTILRTVQTAFDDTGRLVRQNPDASKNNLFDVKK